MPGERLMAQERAVHTAVIGHGAGPSEVSSGYAA
jgi:hypothetical protein